MFNALKALDKLNLNVQQLQQQQQYNILLFGETGSGKSTLINYLTNYFLGGSLRKMKIAIDTPYLKATERWKSIEKNLKDKTKSKTSECTVYDFTKDGLHYNFIDTPGLGDTAGTEEDDRHIDKIMSFAEKTGTLAAIIIVINGTVARATVNLQNTLVRLRGSVPDILLKNLLVVLTNCSVASANFDLASLKPWTVPEDHVFYMENSALSKPVKDWINNRRIQRILRNDWQESMEEIDNMIKQITELGHFATNAFGDMLRQRNQIKSKVHEILLEIKKLQDLQSELDSAQHAKQNIATDIEKYSNYKQTKQVEYDEMVDADYHSTICMKHTTVCHDGCGLTYTSTKGADIFKGCSCMSGPMCGTCGCDHLEHYHDKKRKVRKTKTVEDILHDMKALYDHHTKKEVDLSNKITDLNTDITAVQQALNSKEDEINKCCQELKELCSQFNFVDELRSITNTMKAHARTLTSVCARDEAESRIKRINLLADQLTSSQRNRVC